MLVRIDPISPLSLPEDCGMRRTPPRAPGQMEPGYLEKYDATTFFYDVFRTADGAIAVAPPLRNFKSLLEGGRVRIDGRSTADHHAVLPFDRVSTVRFDLPPGSPAEIVSVASGDVTVSASFTKSDPAVFRGRRVVFTLSKDNDLQWIVDWARFYASVHACDAVLFYDNASTRYSVADLAEALSGVPGLEVIVVVSWPFKYGPLSAAIGGRRKRFDSNYCQLGMIEHARRKFLAEADVVINADIDELIVTDDGRPVGEHLAGQGDGYLLFSGVWIPVDRHIEGSVRHLDYLRYRPGNLSTNTKWVIHPPRIPEDRQWMIHTVKVDPKPAVADVVLRHFVGISQKRADLCANPASLVLDEPLVRDMRRAFGADAPT